jgi:hypothetical protein
LGKCILHYLDKITDTFLCDTAVLGIKLMLKTADTFAILEISQFLACSLSHIKTRKVLLSNKDREIFKKFIAIPSVQKEYV